MPDLLLAYTPFIDPLDLHDFWYLLLIPLAFGVAVVYKAVRCGNLRLYPKHVLLMTTQIIVGIVFLGLVSFAVLNWLLPLTAPMPGG